MSEAERGQLKSRIDTATLRLAPIKARISGIIFPMCGRYTFTFSAKSLAEAFDTDPQM
jgi:hypothetical protein